VGEQVSLGIKSASGIGEMQTWDAGPAMVHVCDWFPTENRILLGLANASTSFDLFTLELAPGARPQPLVQGPFVEGRGRISPDGRWLAYESHESGRPEIYVMSLKGDPGRWQISARGGSDPCWARNGRELFFLSDQHLMTTPVTIDASFHPGTPRPLFRVQTEVSTRRNVYEVSPDGSRFLFLVNVSGQETPMTVVVNWRSEEQR
jgi:Tol biopolymer transport system component